VALIVGITPPAQYDLFPPLTGGSTVGHAQFGAVTLKVFRQVPLFTVIVIFVPVGTFVIVHIFPPALVTVPALLVTVPPLTVTPREYVRRLGAHVTGVEIVIVGKVLTVIPKLELTVPLPHAFTPLTVRLPDVAFEANEIVTELPVPDIDAPLPE